MNKKIKILIIGSIGIILSGCGAKQYSITYNTNPTGASVICQGINKGYSPLTLYYTPDEKQWDDGQMRTISCTANWISGARKTFGTTWDLKKFPDGVMRTLQRPSGDGYSTDVQFALQVQNMKYQQRQAQAAEANARANKKAASDAFYQNLERNNKLQQQNYQLNSINNYLKYGY